ncbi:MAG: hypothetical protein RLZ35_221 [Pseudomonadota bacterium]|jgi:DNA-binding phage protein
MALTKEFKKTVSDRARRDPEFRKALLQEAMNEFLAGDLDTAKIVLRDYINASTQFNRIAKQIHKNDKSVQRMLSPKGNPTTSNFCLLLNAIQKTEGVTFEVNIR